MPIIVIPRNLLSLDSIILFSNDCLLQSDFGGGEVKGDTFNAISCLRFEDIGNFNDALLKGTLLTKTESGRKNWQNDLFLVPNYSSLVVFFP